MSTPEIDPFEEELEAEVRKVLNPGPERRRQVAVRDLHTPGPAGPIGRVFVVTLGIGSALALLFWMALALL